MFYAVDLLSLRNNKKGRLPRCWLAATLKNYRSKMSKEEINSVQIDCACDDIIEGLIGHEGVPRLSLYLSAQLSYGTIKIFQDQVNDLYEETLKLLSLPSPPKKKKSKKTKAADEKKDKEVENLNIDLPKGKSSQHILDVELSGVDIEKTFEGFDQTDRHQLIEINEYEVIDEPYRLPSLGIIDHVSSLTHETDIEEFIKNFPTVQRSEAAGGGMDQRAAESIVEDNDPPATPKRTSQEAGDNIEQRAPAAVVEDNDPPVTPKRKSRQQHDETPKKRKRILPIETARSPSHHSARQSLLNNLMETESIQANTALTGNLDLHMNESSQEVQMPENDQRFSPPTESTGTQPMAIRENIGNVLVNPIIEITEVTTIVADEPENIESSGLLRPEQPIISSRPLRAESPAPEDNERVQDNEQETDRPQIQQPTVDQDSEFVLLELDTASVTLSTSRRRRKVFKDNNKQIKIKYVSDSNALDNIYTRTRESTLPDTHGKIPANLLLSLPSVGLKNGLRGNRATCSLSAKVFKLSLNNIEKPCTNELDLEQLPRRDDFVNKSPRRSEIHRKESTVEARSRTLALSPCSPSHTQWQIDQQLMPPPSAPVSLLQSREHPSPRPSRGFPESIEPALAASPRQARQLSQPSTINPDIPDVPQADAALPTGESVMPPEADQAGVEPEALHDDIPMPLNELVERPETNVDEVQTDPQNIAAAMSESFLAGVRWQRRTESTQNETEGTLPQSTHEIFITRDEFYELLQKLWEVIMEFSEPPRLSFDDVFIKGEISVLEVSRYFKYLFEFEQKRILCIEEVSPFENYISKSVELEV